MEEMLLNIKRKREEKEGNGGGEKRRWRRCLEATRRRNFRTKV